MWETPFDPSMLVDSSVIVYCPDAALAGELMDVLAENGVIWCGGGEVPSKYNSRWNDSKKGTCYWIEDGSMSYENRQYAEDYADDFPNHIKCTFYGEAEDFEPAGDDELMAFLGL